MAVNFAASRLAVPPILDTKRFLDQLPPRIRANVVWAAKPIREGLAELRSNEPDRDRLARVADELMEPLASLSRAAGEALLEEPQRFELAASADLERERARLEAFLLDEETQDTVEWAFELLGCFLASVMPLIQGRHDVELDFQIEDMRKSHFFVALIRGTTALMAAAEEARIGTNRVVAADLVDLAFLELSTMTEILASEGLELEPFADEPDERRTQRFQRNVEWLRSGLTEAEHEVLTGARLRNLDDGPRH